MLFTVLPNGRRAPAGSRLSALRVGDPAEGALRSAPSEPRHRSIMSGEHDRLRSSKASRIAVQMEQHAQGQQESTFRTSTEPEPKLPGRKRWWRRRRLRSKPKLGQQRGRSLFGGGGFESPLNPLQELQSFTGIKFIIPVS